jgi:predicted amidohydrolase
MRLVLIQMNSRTGARDENVVQASGTEEQLVSAEIDREAVIRARRTFFLFRDRRPDAYGPIVRATEELHG